MVSIIDFPHIEISELKAQEQKILQKNFKIRKDFTPEDIFRSNRLDILKDVLCGAICEFHEKYPEFFGTEEKSKNLISEFVTKFTKINNWQPEIDSGFGSLGAAASSSPSGINKFIEQEILPNPNISTMLLDIRTASQEETPESKRSDRSDSEFFEHHLRDALTGLELSKRNSKDQVRGRE